MTIVSQLRQPGKRADRCGRAPTKSVVYSYAICVCKSVEQLCSMLSLYGYIGENKMCRLTRLYRARGASQRISENNGFFFHVTQRLSAETAFPVHHIYDTYAILLKYFWKLMECWHWPTALNSPRTVTCQLLPGTMFLHRVLY